MGRDLSFKLMKIGYRVACEADTHVQATVSQALKKAMYKSLSLTAAVKRDCLVRRGSTKAGGNGDCHYLVNRFSAAAAGAFTLDTVSGETEWRSSSMSTRTAQNSVTDLLFVGLVQLNDVESLKMIERSSELTQRLK